MGSLTQNGSADWATPGNGDTATHDGVATTTGGSGVGLTVDVVTNAEGAVTDVTVNNGGSGYTPCF